MKDIVAVAHEWKPAFSWIPNVDALRDEIRRREVELHFLERTLKAVEALNPKWRSKK